MGRLTLSTSPGLPPSANVRREFSRDVPDSRLEQVLLDLSKAPSFVTGRVACVLYGMGAQRRALYLQLARQPGIELMLCRSLLSSWRIIFRPLVASYEALLRVSNPTLLPSTFEQIVHRSMAGAYFLDPSLLSRAALGSVRASEGLPFDLGMRADPRHALYILDADNAESTSGYHEIVSYGPDAPVDLRDAIEAR